MEPNISQQSVIFSFVMYNRKQVWKFVIDEILAIAVEYKCNLKSRVPLKNVDHCLQNKCAHI